MDSSLDNSWGLMPSNISLFPLSKAANDGSLLPSNYSQQLHGMQDIGQPSMSSMSGRQQQQPHAFFGTEFGSSEPAKHESQSLRPFFDEWPNTRESWSDLDDNRCNRTSYSTTQLSISIPMASSDFSRTSPRSPDGIWAANSNLGAISSIRGTNLDVSNRGRREVQPMHHFMAAASEKNLAYFPPSPNSSIPDLRHIDPRCMHASGRGNRGR
ncbi:hypothetical protein J5N97_018863 [Dioscorea zingiberensis]|uniref:Growth-regulating factor n=1 Tax=Dioscorea zingiberensis TaxID=325984 RepID=A0A9D5CDJ0_9LILI|nr:hypothetical protein J5N97_018863 [Dioscorea zingiberensis]